MEPDTKNNNEPVTLQEPALDQAPNPEPNPIEPVAPVEPVEPVEPVSPVEPTISVEPTTPVEPTNPVEPIDPVEPTDQTTTTEPIQPAPTAEPETPSKSRSVLLAVILVALMIVGGVGAALFLSGEQGDKKIDNSTSDQDTPTTEKDKYDLSTISDFDLSFLKLENNDKNVIYSPLSIKFALAMLADAADNDSETQIRDLIGNFKPKFYLNSENLSLANAMFIRNEIKDEIYDTYTDTIKENYNAEVVYDSFESPDSANKWISDKTLGIIKQTLRPEDITNEVDYLLINALAIDMNWNYALQCAYAKNVNVGSTMPCKEYYVTFAHEKYYTEIYPLDSDNPRASFNGSSIPGAEIGTTANRYDIINEIGEDAIRAKVLEKYEEYKKENGEDKDFDIDNYMTGLSKNYGKLANSTDFYYSITDDEKVFAKDLKEYDGTTLQYIGIMPKNQDLSNYIENFSAKKITSLISSLKDASDINSFKDGVVTKITGTIPFYKFSYNLNLKEDLKTLGVTDVFDSSTADLSKMTSLERPRSYIHDAIHKANIDFSNEGIKAAAVTVMAGGRGGRGGFDYSWDVPVEEIDLSFDKPFFFIIRDKASGAVWFTGTVYQPTE